MRKISVDEPDRVPSPASVRRPLADALGAEEVAINYYELAPGESFAFGYHAHDEQEELFYVLSGTATFETEEGDVAVGAGEVVRFAPGEFQQGWNRGDDSVTALALGAPKAGGGAEVYRECPECGDRTRVRFDAADGGRTRLTFCSDCGAETGRFSV